MEENAKSRRRKWLYHSLLFVLAFSTALWWAFVHRQKQSGTFFDEFLNYLFWFDLPV